MSGAMFPTNVKTFVASTAALVLACAPAPKPGPAQRPAETGPPSAADCDGLWARYHALVPVDPSITRDGFMARCRRSGREVLACPERVKSEMTDIVRRASDGDRAGGAGPDAGASAAEVAAREALQVRLLFRIAGPSRMGICMTRARVRFALRTGELAALAGDVTGGRLVADQEGILIAPGDYATLPWRGVNEGLTGAATPAPPGEVRVSRRPDGRVWLYFLGGLLGRHQNQVGFLYSSAPLLLTDFASNGPGPRVCLDRVAHETRPPPRYLLRCFDVVDRLSAQLVEVGNAPD
jgi:hypothetical protein